jgi:hypothetical protein
MTGKAAERDGERRCVVTRAALPADALIRFVAGPDGRLVPDIRRKLPGRGVWTMLSAEAVRQAVKTGAFPRALKARVEVGPALDAEVDALLARDALQALAMANKAGLLVTGFGKVEAAAGGHGLAALVEAADGAADGRRKILQALHRAQGERAGRTPVVDCFEARDLALALGRDLVIHAALKSGAASGAFLERWRRLVHFRTRPLPPKDLSAGASQSKTSTAGPMPE